MVTVSAVAGAVGAASTIPVTLAPDVVSGVGDAVVTAMLVLAADFVSVSVTAQVVPIANPFRVQFWPLARFFCMGVPAE